MNEQTKEVFIPCFFVVVVNVNKKKKNSFFGQQFSHTHLVHNVETYWIFIDEVCEEVTAVADYCKRFRETILLKWTVDNTGEHEETNQ